VKLQSRAVVTTTWKEWRADHPHTTVLSPDTGYKRDYSEGAAYRDYFATDQLMFRVSNTDTRLRSKAEVLVLQSDSTVLAPRVSAQRALWFGWYAQFPDTILIK